jgi:hypothetical protein
VLVYLAPEARHRFVRTVTALDAHWLSTEGEGVVTRKSATDSDLMVVCHNGKPVAHADGHGRFLRWFT